MSTTTNQTSQETIYKVGQHVLFVPFGHEAQAPRTGIVTATRLTYRRKADGTQQEMVDVSTISPKTGKKRNVFGAIVLEVID